MPQATQIVPKYLHSHVETYINDYTQFEDAASTAVDNNYKFICVFRSGMGPDNVLLAKDNLKDFLATYGNSNYAKYGQPLMMPIAMLTSGTATVYSMRVMPDDAVNANSILVMQYRFDEDNKKMQIRYSSQYLDKTGLGEVASGSAAVNSSTKTFIEYLNKTASTLVKDSVQDEKTGLNWKQVPIATFCMSGRGVYGNNYRWRITRNLQYEKDYGIMMYTFETINTADSFNVDATYVGGLVSSTQYKSLTLINDILDDQEKGAVMMNIHVFDENVETVFDEYKKFLEGLGETCPIDSADEFDIFTGHQVGEVGVMGKIDSMEIISEAEGTEDINVDRLQGVALMGGDDGAFAGDDDTVAKATTKCYVNAFAGVYDNTILSDRRTPCDAILDADYPFEAKEVLAEMVNTRESCLAYIDAGTETTKSKMLAIQTAGGEKDKETKLVPGEIINQYAAFNTRNLVKEFQHYTTKDPGTNKKCEVTVTYFYAQSLAKHYKNYGSWVPFVKSRCQLSGHIKNSLEPAVDDLSYEFKEILYNSRFNYFETIDENTYQRAAQNTAQPENSDLMEENNMNTLFALKKQLERDCWNSLYDFTSSEDRARFSESENAKFASWIGSRLDTLSIIFDANEWEAERSIVHCYVSVQFRNLMKRVIIEIDVNKRNFTA